MTWPEVGTPVMVVLKQEERPHLAEVLGRDPSGKTIDISVPMVRDDPFVADPGDSVTITWPKPGGLSSAVSRIVESTDKHRVWRISPTPHLAEVNRRRHPRVQWHSVGRVRSVGGVNHDVAVLDVSQGGFKAVAQRSADLRRGNLVEAAIATDADPVVAYGRIAWRKIDGRTVEVGVEIQQMAPADVGKLRGIVEGEPGSTAR